MLGRLCHGRERRPMEPYGVIAPLARAIAWGLVCLGSLSCSAALVAGAAGHLRAVTVLAGAGGVTLAVGAAVRVVAMSWRPSPLPLTAWDVQDAS